VSPPAEGTIRAMSRARLREELADTRYALRHLLNTIGAETTYEADVHDSGDWLSQAYVQRAYRTPEWRRLREARSAAYRTAWEHLYRRLARARRRPESEEGGVNGGSP